METFDAIIAGGGPAGCALAAVLARSGQRALVVEKCARGQEKVCGGFLGPETAEAWKALDWEASFRELPKNLIREVAVSGPGSREALASRFDGEAWSVDRAGFGDWLAERAAHEGADVRHGTEVTHAVREGGVWRVRLGHGAEEIRSRRYFVATGRRRPAEPDSPRNFFACRTAYDGARAPVDRVSLHFVRKGHVGLNPLGAGRTAMCLYVEKSRLKASAGDLDGMMRGFFSENRALARDLDGARRTAEWRCCPAEPDRRRIFYRDGIFYAGDAVTMVEPVIGGGIPIALFSGALLGGLVAASPRADDGTLARDYRRLWERRFLGRVRVASVFGAAERSGPFSRSVFALMDRAPRVFPRMVAAARPVSPSF